VLLALALQPSHGYGLREQVQQDSFEMVGVGRGSIYRTLTGMERMGLVELVRVHDDGPGRQARWYAMTAGGRQVLDWEIERARMIVHLGYERLGKPKKELDSSFFRGFAG
jgi:DNA-binding PadR family transcriptional regulator